MINIIRYILLTSIFTNCNSSVESEDSPILHAKEIKSELTDKYLMGQYDSVFVYEDVHWISFQGVGEKRLRSKGLNYPISIFAYKGNKLSIITYFDESEILTTCVVSLYNEFDFSYCFYYSRDARDTLAECSFFTGNKKRINFLVSKASFLKNDFLFSGFRVWEEDTLSNEYFYNYYSSDYSGKKYELQKCINQLTQGNDFIEYDVFQKTKYRIDGTKFLQTYDKRLDRFYPEENWERNDIEVQYKNLRSQSFFLSL
ncbi:MAG: hypothetical protein NVV59_17800 [Chitinophagaceae bacterium]|nr:hypothetical protein [Chitinophagaceae bacterium]